MHDVRVLTALKASVKCGPLAFCVVFKLWLQTARHINCNQFLPRVMRHIIKHTQASVFSNVAINVLDT